MVWPPLHCPPGVCPQLPPQPLLLPWLWAPNSNPLKNRIYSLDKHFGCKEHRLTQAILGILFFFGGGHMAWNWEGLRYQDSIPNTSASSTFIRPLPWGAQARSLQGAFSQAERSTTGELLTSLGQVFPEATLGVQGNRELVLSTPLVASLTFPGQAPAQYCFLQRGQGSRAARRKC